MKQAKKNYAKLEYKEVSYYLWQDEHNNWNYQIGKLNSVNSQQKELQFAINQIHESVRDMKEKPPQRVFVPTQAVYERRR